MNGMNSFSNGCAEYHRATRYQEQVRQLDEQYRAAIEAPLRERIAELEGLLANTEEAIDWLAYHLKVHHECKHMDAEFSGIAAWIVNVKAALNKEKP